MTGVVDVEGKEYRVSAWSNTSKNGMKYLSLKVSEKQDGQQMQSQKNDEEMPF